MRRAFGQRFGREPAVLVRVPGCMQPLGAETAVHAGLVLAAATEPSVVVAAAPAEQPRATIQKLTSGETCAFSLPALALEGAPTTSAWVNLPIGAAWALQQSGRRPVGLAAVVGGDLPMGLGLGAKTAVLYAFVLVWERLAGWTLLEAARRHLVASAETAYLGLGANKAAALVAGQARRGHFLHSDLRDESVTHLPLPRETAVVLAAVGDAAATVSEADVSRAVAYFRSRLGASTAWRDVTLADFERLADNLPAGSRRAAWQIVADCHRLPLALAALQQGDGRALGQVLSKSQANVGGGPVTQALLARVSTLPGWLGARLVGRVVQMVVEPDAVASVTAAVAALAETGQPAAAMATALSASAAVVD